MKKGLPKPMVDRFRQRMRIRIDRLVCYIIENTPEIVFVYIEKIRRQLQIILYYVLVLYGFFKKINRELNRSFSDLLFFFKLSKIDDIVGYKLMTICTLCYWLFFFGVAPTSVVGNTAVIILSTLVGFVLILTSRAMLPRYRLDHLISINWYVLVFFIFLGLLSLYIVFIQ